MVPERALRPGEKVTDVTSQNDRTMRLTAPTVPVSAVIEAAKKMRAAGIPPNQSSLIRYAIAKLINLPDDQIAEFSLPRLGRSNSDVFSIKKDE
jgi:hypothetical protein